MTAVALHNRRLRVAMGALAGGVFGYLLTLAISIALDPRGLALNRGFSYYGDQPETVWLYRLGLVLSGLGFLGMAVLLPGRGWLRWVKLANVVMVPLLAGILITTAPNSPSLDVVHIRLGVALFAVQYALAAWLALGVCRRPLPLALFGLLSLVALAALLSVLWVLHWLLQAQALFQLMFVVLTLVVLGRRG